MRADVQADLSHKIVQLNEKERYLNENIRILDNMQASVGSFGDPGAQPQTGKYSQLLSDYNSLLYKYNMAAN